MKQLLTVTEESQQMHLQLLVGSFTSATRRIRASARSKMRASAGDFDKMADFACLFFNLIEEAKKTDGWNAEMEATLWRSFRAKNLSLNK